MLERILGWRVERLVGTFAGQHVETEWRIVHDPAAGPGPTLGLPDLPTGWVYEGWAVFDDPKLPIIGEGDQQPNDNFRQELVSGAEAAVKVMVDRGIADPDRRAPRLPRLPDPAAR